MEKKPRITTGFALDDSMIGGNYAKSTMEEEDRVVRAKINK